MWFSLPEKQLESERETYPDVFILCQGNKDGSRVNQHKLDKEHNLWVVFRLSVCCQGVHH